MQQDSLFPEKKPKDKAINMMDQYLSIKRQYPETILFYRMGDFYEMFFDDAIDGAEILNITLTQRGKHRDKPIPMCGVPVHNAENYLRRLIASGRQVTICEQTETPEQAKKRGGSKALVKRRAVRMVTAGTLLDDELLEDDRVNRLACLALIREDWALAWLELTSGTLHTRNVSRENLTNILAELEPNELLTEDTLPEDISAQIHSWHNSASVQLSTISRREYQLKNCNTLLEDTLGKQCFADFSDTETIAAGVLIGYVKRTQMGKLPKILPPKKVHSSKYLVIDSATRRNLELSRTLNGEKKGSLLNRLDRCSTSAGKRLLTTMLHSPLADCDEINQRLDCVEGLFSVREARENLRQELRNLPDMTRPLSRLQLSHDSPKDLKSIQIALEKIQKIQRYIRDSSLSPAIAEPWSQLYLPHNLSDLLMRALADEMPKKLSDGGVIRSQYDEILDHHCSLRDDARRLMMSLQIRLQSETGIDKLKIKFNNMLGYFIEVPERFSKQLDPADYIHRSSIQSAARFTTNELIELARAIQASANNAQAREEELYAELIAETLKVLDSLTDAANLTAWLDVTAGLAQLASDEHYTRPTLYTDYRFEIEGGRHPVVEKSLKDAAFIANNCRLEDDQRLWLLSGPNMAGKSTFLRQNALIVIMAQMGCFVPAKAAHIGIVDQLFSRVGAADDLARGHSTFMVEMIECAAILRQSTARSFVILDEIGRGTATYDGLSIAWACVEYLHETNRCRALFATHYHELSEALEDQLSHLKSHHLKVQEWQGEIVFIHEVAEGRAAGSYGVHVAKLAGLPASVISRAQNILSTLEQEKPNMDIPLQLQTEEKPDADHTVIAQLRAIDPDSLTARDALDLLYSLKLQIADSAQ